MGEKAWRTPWDRDPTISRVVKLQYRTMVAAKKQGQLKEGQRYHVIYGLMQKRSLFTGVKLSKPVFEVGRFVDAASMKKIVGAHKVSLSSALGKSANNYFALAYFEFQKDIGILPKDAKFKDYFEAVPIDVAWTEKEAKDLEIFYTIYVNRKNGENAYGLEENKFFNAVVGDLSNEAYVHKTRDIYSDLNDMPQDLRYATFVTKDHLDSAIEQGLEEKDLMWYFKESIGYVRRIVSHYYPGMKFHEVRDLLVGQRVKKLAKLGIPYEKLNNYFVTLQESAVFIRENYKKASFEPNLQHYTHERLVNLFIRSIGEDGYNKLVFENIKQKLKEKVNEGGISRDGLIALLIGVKGYHVDPLIKKYIKVGMGRDSGLSGMVLNYLVAIKFADDIVWVLSKKDYGVYGIQDKIPIQLVKDLGLYTKNDPKSNLIVEQYLAHAIENQFGMTDLSAIYKILSRSSL